jgi:uridine phosphorylase
MDVISHTDLILNPDGSIYHLHLHPEDIADTILLVGDPGRVHQVSDHFDKVERTVTNREFVTHTGTYRGKSLTVLSTGIGTDNIDIVLNELDSLVNVDLAQRKVKSTFTRLRFIRLGTSGALHPDIQTGTTIVSKVAGGLDGLYHFYRDERGIVIPGISEAFMAHTGWRKSLSHPYFVEGSEALISLFKSDRHMEGITLSTPGFYAPQVRSIRLPPFDDQLIPKIESFKFKGLRINNFEMESSALYALSALMGHAAITLCVAIANRVTLSFLEDYKPVMDRLICMVLEKLAAHD